jgi:serine/threonine protein kinase/phage FluMu protein Com
MINFLCNHCGAQLRVPNERAGVSKKCPRCGRTVEAPTDTGGTGASSSARKSIPTEASDSGTRNTFEPADSVHEEELSLLAPAQGPDELGRIANYRVLSVLGSGGMGIVFRAEDLNLRRQVALKVMKKVAAQNPINRERFLREAQSAAAIEHDHIVPIYDADEDRGIPYLAMKLLVGESLEERLNRQAPLPVAEILRIGIEIADGLSAAHERELIHRDIKPANIWLEEGRDRVKIVDFGLAARTGSEEVRLTQENFLVGTPMYMSPEQASGDLPLDHRTDLFSLGSVLYRMATGKLPFKGKTTINVLTALATKKPKSPRSLNPTLPRALSALIVQLLQKNPDDRPRNARLVVATLTEIKDAPPDEGSLEDDPEIVDVEPEPEPKPEPVPEVEPPPRRPRPMRRRPRGRDRESYEDRIARRVIKFAIFAGVCVALLLGFLVIKNTFFKKPDDPPANKKTDDQPAPPSATNGL